MFAAGKTYCQIHARSAPGVFAGEREGQMDPPPAAGKIARMQMPDALEVKLKRVSHAFWQHRHPFAHPFAVAHGDLAIAEIDILDAEPKAFEQPQSAPVEKFAHQLIRAPELIEDGPRFSSGKDDRDFRGTFYALNVVEKAESSPQNFLIEKKQRREGLVLSGSCDVFFYGQVGQEGGDLAFTHFSRVPFLVEEDEAPDPIEVGLFGAQTGVLDAQLPADAIEKFGA